MQVCISASLKRIQCNNTCKSLCHKVKTRRRTSHIFINKNIYFEKKYSHNTKNAKKDNRNDNLIVRSMHAHISYYIADKNSE